eukprot:3068301-Amphidinium_carterae.1
MMHMCSFGASPGGPHVEQPCDCRIWRCQRVHCELLLCNLNFLCCQDLSLNAVSLSVTVFFVVLLTPATFPNVKLLEESPSIDAIRFKIGSLRSSNPCPCGRCRVPDHCRVSMTVRSKNAMTVSREQAQGKAWGGV